MFIVDIGFSHREEPLLIMREAYTHIVSIGSAACQKPLGTMREAFGDNVKSYSADCSAVTIRKNYPPIHQTPRKPRYTGRLRMVYSFRTIHQLYTILFTKTVNRL
jgi:hypothetical protein